MLCICFWHSGEHRGMKSTVIAINKKLLLHVLLWIAGVYSPTVYHCTTLQLFCVVYNTAHCT